MNFLSRGIWLLLNLTFGATASCILFYWVACDMQMPLAIENFIAAYLPPASVLFKVPYVHIEAFSSSVITKLIFNGFLYAIFGFAHTFFAQEFVQAFLARYFFPKQALRTIYCIIVTITAFTIMGLWQHTGIQLWNALPPTMNDYEKQHVLLAIYSILYAPGFYVIIVFNPFEFCGLKQLFGNAENSGCPLSSPGKLETRTTGNPTLVTSGLFRYCRHPLYLVTILALALTPVMSLDRLAFVFYTCSYALIGVPLEERKLVKIFGQSYIDYQSRVPAIFPFTKPKAKQN